MICPICNKEIRNCNFKKHTKICKGNKPKYWTKNENGKYICDFCNKEFSKDGIGNHIKYNHLGFKGSKKGINKGNIPWNKGLTKDTDERILSASLKTKGRKLSTKRSEETCKKYSDNAKRNCFGGHTSKNSIYYLCKNGTIVYLHSSYEKEMAENLDKNNINWIRPEPFLYIGKDNKQHRYYPDFYLVDYDIYLDPKNNYLITKDQEKINLVSTQNNIKIFILNKDQLTWEYIKNLL